VARQHGGSGARTADKAFGDGQDQRRQGRAGIGAAHRANEQRNELGRTGEIDRRDIATERDLIPEQGGKRIGLGIAPDVAQQGLIVDLAISTISSAPRPAASPKRTPSTEDLSANSTGWPIARSVAIDRAAMISERRISEDAVTARSLQQYANINGTGAIA
jgi:hypothetical protein